MQWSNTRRSIMPLTIFCLLLGIVLPVRLNAAPVEIIIDNSDLTGVAQTGNWVISTQHPSRYGANYAHDAKTGKGEKSMTYTPTITLAGEYDVYMRWNSDTNRASNVPVDIAHREGASTVLLNQRLNGTAWNMVGRYSFDAGTDGYIRIRTDATDGFVIADAVRLVKVPEVTVDNIDAVTTGTWTTSTNAGIYHGINYMHDGGTDKGEKSITYTPTIPESGEYDVYVMWNSASNRAYGVPIDIVHGGGSSTLAVNQRADGGWNRIGRYSFNAGTGGSVTLRNDGTDGYVIADAVRFVKAPPPQVQGTNYSPSGTLIFRSGFEAGSAGVSNAACLTDITGTDDSVEIPNNWVSHLDGYSKFGDFTIQYDGGTCADRYASIVTDPANSGNKVLKFWLGEVDNTENKGRIQANLYNNTSDLSEIYYKFGFYLHPDLEMLKLMPDPLTWLTLAEFWNQPGWTETTQYPYRVSLDLSKSAGGGASQTLHFHAKGQRTPVSGSEGQFDTVWMQQNFHFSVPTGQWLTGEIYYKQGDAQTGRFYFAVTPQGGSKQVIFDIVNWTYHPDNPAPGGLTHFNPIKLYTGKQTVDFVGGLGGALDILWDDMEFWPSMNE